MAVKQRVIVIGLGSIGRRHARLLAARPELEVELCDPDVAATNQVRRELNIESTYSAFDAAIRSQPDMVVIATPHSLHVPQAIEALEAGIHVLCEKPMSDSLDSAYALQKVAQGSDRVLTFGFHLHFHPGLRRLKQMIDEGKLGTVLHAHSRVGSYITLVNSVSRYQTRLRGALLLDYSHQTDIFHWLTGQEPSDVHIHALQAGSMELTANPNVLLITCEYAIPLLTTIHLNYIQMPERHEYEIVGDKGWVILDAASGYLRYGEREGNTMHEEHLSFERDELYNAEHQAFLDAIAGKRLPESPVDSAIVSMKIFDAALHKLKS